MLRRSLVCSQPARRSMKQDSEHARAAQAGKLRFLQHKGWQDAVGSTKGTDLLGRRIREKEPGFADYYGGRRGDQAEEEKAKAWRDLRRESIDIIRSDRTGYAAPEPMVRSKKTQAAAKWEELLEETPLGETQVTSRKNKLVQHLIRLRTNPKYRWKQEKFVVRSPETVASLAQSGYLPELLLLDPHTTPPKNLNMETTRAVIADKYVVAAAAGGGGPESGELSAGMVAEYFIPQEQNKVMLWHDDGPAVRRAAVVIGAKDEAHLGTLVRAAVGLGCDTVLLMEDCADPFSTEVLDYSHAAHVTAGGYPTFHILREEEGDDPWGIVNRMIRRHSMEPVLAATLTEDADASLTTDQLWRDLHEEGSTDASFCLFFGCSTTGLDVDYVKHNVDSTCRQVFVPVNSVTGLSATTQSIIALNALMEPTYVSPTPPKPVSVQMQNAAKVRVMTPLTREISEDRAAGREPQLVPVPNPSMTVSKFYKQRAFGRPPYKTEVTIDWKTREWGALTAPSVE